MNLLDLARSALPSDVRHSRATSEQAVELRRLVPVVCARIGEEDVESALALALADPDAALACYRALAAELSDSP